MPKQYSPFEIRMQSLSSGRYALDVRGLGGDASDTLTLPTDDPSYQALAARLERFDVDEETMVELGQKLFDVLFQGKVKDVYTRSQGMLGPDQRLQLRLNIDATATNVTALPWEFLTDPDQGPLAMLDVSVMRYVPFQVSTPALAISLPLKVLLTGAMTPPEPEVERELAEVQRTLADLEKSGHVTIAVEPHLTRLNLQRLLRQSFHIWHFVGHGSFGHDERAGMLLLEDPAGGTASVSASELNILLHRTGVRLVVLDACHSGRLMLDSYRSLAPALIRAQIPAVVVVQFSVPEETTRVFMGEFYRTLAEGFPIDASITEGRKAVMSAIGLSRADWGIPIVYTRAPDGQLFDLSETMLPPTNAPSLNAEINSNVASISTLVQGPSNDVHHLDSTTISGATIVSKASSADDERNEAITALTSEIKEKRRRLNALRLQAAKGGSMTDPFITIQIEDLEKEIAKLQKDLVGLAV